jgi:hypothetical protein
MKRLTAFSWGYRGWGNHTRDFVRTVDAIERARGKRPPIFVDIRFSRSVRQTRRTVPVMFSIELVQASDRPQLCRELQTIDSQHLVEPFEDAGGNTGRLLVEPAGEIAQQPLGLVGILELPGLAQRARRTEACKGLSSRSITLRASWSWHRWIGVWGPKVRRMTLLSALAPSMMNSRSTAGSSPRSMRLLVSAWTA